MPGRTKKVTEEPTKHGTRTADGQRRMRAKQKDRAVAAGLVDEAASQRDVREALAAVRAPDGRKTFEEQEAYLDLGADVMATVSQISFFPSIVMTLQIPPAYRGDIAALADLLQGSVVLRLYVPNREKFDAIRAAIAEAEHDEAAAVGE